MTISSLLAELNPSQQTAATVPPQRTLVLAGAGKHERALRQD